jgi:hypothetical protein
MGTRRGRRSKAVRTPVFWLGTCMNTSLLSPPVRRRPRWGGLIPGADAGAGERGASTRHRGHPDRRQRHGRAHQYDLRFFLWRRPPRSRAAAARLTLPYDRYSPHQDLVSDRLLALSRLAQSDQWC